MATVGVPTEVASPLLTIANGNLDALNAFRPEQLTCG
jgi:hypothetical protein